MNIEEALKDIDQLKALGDWKAVHRLYSEIATECLSQMKVCMLAEQVRLAQTHGEGEG